MANGNLRDHSKKQFGCQHFSGSIADVQELHVQTLIHIHIQGKGTDIQPLYHLQTLPNGAGIWGPKNLGVCCACWGVLNVQFVWPYNAWPRLNACLLLDAELQNAKE